MILKRISTVFLVGLFCFCAHADSKSSLIKTSEAFQQVAEEALPAVVFIDVESKVEVDTRAFEHPFLNNFLAEGGKMIRVEENTTAKGKAQGSLSLKTDIF